MKKTVAATTIFMAVMAFSASPLLATGYTLETKSVKEISEALPIEDEPDPMDNEDTRSGEEISEALPIEDEPDPTENEESRSGDEAMPIEDQPDSTDRSERKHRGWSLDLKSE